jgi:DNA-binding XRE family transcriptional regulator
MDEIKDLRAVLRWTQEELAGALGVSRATIANWEQGRVKPSKLAACSIAAFASELKEKCHARRK